MLQLKAKLNLTGQCTCIVPAAWWIAKSRFIPF